MLDSSGQNHSNAHAHGNKIDYCTTNSSCYSHRLASTSAYWHLPRERNEHLQGTIDPSHNTNSPVGRSQTYNSDELIGMQLISFIIRVHRYIDTVELADIEQGALRGHWLGNSVQERGRCMAWLIWAIYCTVHSSIYRELCFGCGKQFVCGMLRQGRLLWWSR